MKLNKCLIFLFCLLVFLKIANTNVYAANENCNLTAGFWVEDSFHDFFDPAKNAQSRNTFEQWADNQMSSWNQILAKAGARDCFRIGKIVRVADGALPLGYRYLSPFNFPNWQDRSTDVVWGFPASGLIGNPGISYWQQVLNGTDWGLLHELNHARYLIDEYSLDFRINSGDALDVIDPQGKPLAGNYFKPIKYDVIYYNKSQDIMSDPNNNHFYAPHSVGALNRIAGQHNAERYGNFNPPRNIGEYLNDLPLNNSLKILDNKGNPLEGAQIKIFQSEKGDSGDFYAKKVDNAPDIEGITNNEGKISIGHNPFGSTGFYSPFANQLFLLGVFYKKQFFYKFMEVSDFNLAYWAGATNEAGYVIQTNIALDAPTPTPTPTPTFKGQYIDQNNNPISLQGMMIRILDLPKSLEYQIIDAPNWTWTGDKSNANKTIRVTAAQIPGYTVSNMVCNNCTSPTAYPYNNGNSFDIVISENAYYGIYFKYVPVSTPTITPITSPTTNPTSSPTSTPSPKPSSKPTPASLPISFSKPSPMSPPISSPESITKILISNYSDFRNSNVSGDLGSPTITIDNPNGQTITWTLNTLNSASKKPFYIRTITDGEYKDYAPSELGDGNIFQGITELPNIKIQAKMIKKITKMIVTVNGQEQNVDFNNPQDITVALQGSEGQPQKLSIPYVIEYSNGEITRSALVLNYLPIITTPNSPPSSAPIPTLIPTLIPTKSLSPALPVSKSSSGSAAQNSFTIQDGP